MNPKRQNMFTQRPSKLNRTSGRVETARASDVFFSFSIRLMYFRFRRSTTTSYPKPSKPHKGIRPKYPLLGDPISLIKGMGIPIQPEYVPNSTIVGSPHYVFHDPSVTYIYIYTPYSTIVVSILISIIPITPKYTLLYYSSFHFILHFPIIALVYLIEGFGMVVV